MKLKKDFLWGGAISANQSEGAYQEGGRGLSNFDMLPMDERRLKPVFSDETSFLNERDGYYSARSGINFYIKNSDYL